MKPAEAVANLTIAYDLTSKQPGYAFRPPTDSYSDELLKAVWKQAMPRGQGWRGLIGAESLKCFPIGTSHMAVSYVTVTDQEDESGRTGIRRADIQLLQWADYDTFIRERLGQLPLSVQAEADRKLSLRRWPRIMGRAMRGKLAQVVLAYPYESPENWQLVEAVMLKLIMAWQLKTIKSRRWLNSFTTLALTNREESRIVALPLDKARKVKKLPVIDLS